MAKAKNISMTTRRFSTYHLLKVGKMLEKPFIEGFVDVKLSNLNSYSGWANRHFTGHFFFHAKV